MTGVRGGHATPGVFRTTQNWIGPPGCTLANAMYVPPPPDALVDCLGAWEKFLHERSLPVLVQVALMHVQFEAIHPFIDGNGRVGRLLITLFLVEREVLPAPLLYLSAFFEATRADYYERLQGVHARSEWEAWLEYFLNGVARQSEDALSRAERINALVARWKDELAGASQAALKLVDLLAQNPYCTVRRVEGQLKVAFTTAQRAMERLGAAGILKQVNQAKRDRVYCATALLKIPVEPPYRWREWAAPGGPKRQELQDGTLGAVLSFVNTELLPYLRDLRDKPGAAPQQKVISEIMSGVERTRIDTDRNFLDVLDRVHEISSQTVDPTRSEERRVGKECRSRWSPYH